MNTHLHFTLSRRQLVDRILIPKFYDPDLDEAAGLAAKDYDLPTLGDLLQADKNGSQLGVWLPRENYGSGSIPFARTSDFFHWRIRPDFKKGISAEVFTEYCHRIDIKAGDLLMVAHGSYLVGDVALVTESDVPLLVSDHVFRLRLRDVSKVHPNLLLAAMSTKFVKRQVRARQFSAEIIDKIGNRHLGIKVPIPRSAQLRSKIIELVAEVMDRHVLVRKGIAQSTTVQRAPGPRAVSHFGFTIPRIALVNRILVPRYYDPDLELDIQALEKASGEKWVTIGSLVDAGVLRASAGVEVGKMAYGTGSIPFVRTSDLVDWELFRDPTQGVSQDIYDEYEGKGSLKAEDVIVVRDGTYLVGSSAIVLDEDLPALFCGGIVRLRVANKKLLSPYALMGLLNLPAVRRQMRCKQFTRDVIDTLGPRLLEVRLPPPGSRTVETMEKIVGDVMSIKGEIKTLMNRAAALLEPPVPATALGRPAWSMR
jgi:hypothetical protein